MLLQAQQQAGNEAMLAAQYQQNGEWDKAISLYDKLYDKYPQNYYEAYLQALISAKQLDKAEKLVKKHINKFSAYPVLKVDLVYVLELEGKSDKAKKEFDKILKQLGADYQHAIEIASAFANRNNLDLAIASYKYAQNIAPDPSVFGFELANLYARKGDVNAMIGEYLELLNVNEGYLQMVQNMVQQNLQDDDSGKRKEEIKNLILKKVQQNPNQRVYNELLVWLFVQQKDFEMAYLQVQAMDKRYKQQGVQMIQLGDLCVNNRAYDIALKCFAYVTNMGKEAKYYLDARGAWLNARQLQLSQPGLSNIAELEKLEQEYQNTLSEIGMVGQSASILRGLAHLQAFYLNKTDQAAASLEKTIELSNNMPQFQAQCKLELGDINLLTGQVWEAALLYGQVDKDFKMDPLGEEAKFRNAKLSFYQGDFEWAQAQLDILKAGTTRLIANDAMLLSLLIQENVGEDSSYAPLSMYARANLLAYQHQYNSSNVVIDSILSDMPLHEVADDAIFLKAHNFVDQKKYEEAELQYSKLLSTYPESILVDESLYELASIYDYQFGNKEKAQALYEKLMTDYPASIFVVEARKRFRTLRGDKLN